MADKPFDHLDEMRELREKIARKGRLEMYDPDVLRYYDLRASVLTFRPQTEEGFLRFLQEIHHDYETWLEGEIEEVRGDLQAKLDEATERLRNLAECDQQYLSSESS